MADENDNLWKWPAEHTKLFINLLLQEKSEVLTTGNWSRTSLSFKDRQWTKMATKMRELTHIRRYTVERLKVKLKELRIDFKVFDCLVVRFGFGFDEELGTVTADPQKWDEVIQTNPDAANFRDKGLPHYRLLKSLFNLTFPIGHFRRASKRGPPDSEEEDDVYASMSMSPSQCGDGTSSGSIGKRKAHDDSREKEIAQKKTQFYETLTQFIQWRIRQLKSGGGAMVSMPMPMPSPPPPPSTSNFDVSNAMVVLNEVARENDISKDVCTNAAALFVTSAEHRQAFLRCAPQLRLGWLIHTVGGGGK